MANTICLYMFINYLYIYTVETVYNDTGCNDILGVMTLD